MLTRRPCALMARASSAVSVTSRPARSPPACSVVRDPHTMLMFLPNSRSTASLPRWKPSPKAESTTIDTIPHMMPNIVRKLRSLLARRLSRAWRNDSRMVLGREDDAVALLHALQQLGAGAVADAHRDGHLATARRLVGVEQVDEGLALRV